MNTEFYDAIIIGFGKAGKTLAVALANAGQQVAMVERSPKMYGGTCINIACIPTKALVSAAAHNESFDQAMAHKQAVVSLLHDRNYHMLADNPHVTVIDGEGSFVDSHTVSVRAGDEHILIKAPQIFINTGAEPIIPPITGIEDSRHVYTSTELLDHTHQPQRLAVIGGGYVGLEFASTYAKLGSKVTVFQRSDALFTSEDPQVAAVATQALIDQGIQIVLNANVTHIEDTDSGVLVNGDEFDAVLLATGRRPVTAGLNLEAAGVELTERGAIAVNDLLQTSVPHIWALGDVNGGPQFTYASLDDYRIVKSQLLGDGSYTRAQRKPMAYSVFMQTPLARIGMNEAEARDTGQPVAVKELPASAVPRLHVDGNTTGLLRAIVNPDTKEILGATLLCEGAPEVINLIKTAMDAGLPYTTLRDQVFTHPSVSEALNDLFNM